MQRIPFWTLKVAAIILLFTAPAVAWAQAPAVSSEPVFDSPADGMWLAGGAALSPARYARPLPAAATPATIPPGWKTLVDKSLGYSLSVPADWLTIDLQGTDLVQMAGVLGGEAASLPLRRYLATPAGENLGVFAIEPDARELYARPPFPTFLNVTVTPLADDVSDEEWIALVETSIAALGKARLNSIELGTLNDLPVVRAAAVYEMSSQLNVLNAHLDLTVVRANGSAYALTIATRLSNVIAKQKVIDQIVGTFQPSLPAQARDGSQVQTAAGEEAAAATQTALSAIPRFWKPLVDRRLGYSLEVPFNWLTFDLQAGGLEGLAGLLGGEEAMQLLRDYLAAPAGENLGMLAVELDPEAIYEQPLFPMFLNVSMTPLAEEVDEEEWVALVEESIAALGQAQIESIALGTRSGLPVVRATAMVALGGPADGLTAHLDLTIVRAAGKVYTLTIATRPSAVRAKYLLIEQIVDSFKTE